MDMSLVLKKGSAKTWFDAGLREAKKFGLEKEYIDLYTENEEIGLDPNTCAFNACWDLDLLDPE